MTLTLSPRRDPPPMRATAGRPVNVCRPFINWCEPRSYFDPVEMLRERIRNEPDKSEFRFLIIGALGALCWVVPFLVARWWFA